eukprot:SAG31_NODE_30217_length_384_cov_0.698246_1_plen_37_part_10
MDAGQTGAIPVRALSSALSKSFVRVRVRVGFTEAYVH